MNTVINQPTKYHGFSSAFKQWRTSGKNRRRVPDDLRRQAVGLLKFYRKNEILRAIGTNHSMLNRWSKELAVESSNSSTNNDNSAFVPLPVAHTAGPLASPSTDNDPVPIVTMAHTSGWTLQWHTLPNDHHLQRLLNTIGQLNGAAQ